MQTVQIIAVTRNGEVCIVNNVLQRPSVDIILVVQICDQKLNCFDILLASRFFNIWIISLLSRDFDVVSLNAVSSKIIIILLKDFNVAMSLVLRNYEKF